MQSTDLSLPNLCSVLAEMLERGKTTGRSGKTFESLGALSTLNNLMTLKGLMMWRKPLRTLEIGMAFGGSSLLIAACHRRLDRKPNRQHIALNPFQQGVWDDAAVVALEAAGLASFVDFRPAFSSLELPRLLAENVRFGLIYVDGSHLYEDVFVDAYFAIRLLENDGVVVFDDCTDRHVAKVLRFLERNLSNSMKEIDLSEFRSDRGKSLKYRIGALLGRRQCRAFIKVGEVVRRWDAPLSQF